MATLPTSVTPSSGKWIWANPFGDLSRADSIGASSEVDLYRFVADQTGSYTITMVGGSLDSQFRVYDSSGTPVTGVIDSSGTGGTETITLSLSSGSWYYIAAAGWQTSTGSYT